MGNGAVMAFFLMIAVFYDIRTLKIPNWVSMGGATAGITISCISLDIHSLLSSVGGWAIGLAVMLPFYALRMMGAGDVKLVAMTGAYLGTPSIIGSVAFVLIAGGIFSILVATASGKLAEVFKNLRIFMMYRMSNSAPGSAREAVDMMPVSGKLPYSVPIAAGTLAWLMAYVVS